MQQGSMALVIRKEGPAVWQFRWSEKDLHGARVQKKKVIGTVERYIDEASARCAVANRLGIAGIKTRRTGAELDCRQRA